MSRGKAGFTEKSILGKSELNNGKLENEASPLAINRWNGKSWARIEP